MKDALTEMPFYGRELPIPQFSRTYRDREIHFPRRIGATCLS